MKKGGFLFVLLISMVSWGQKDIHKSLLSPEIETISIDATVCYWVTIETNQNEELLIDASLEGEYAPNQLIDLNTEGNTLHIVPNFRKAFELPNDKLSAHKILSVSLKISVPENKTVTLYGTSSHLLVSGNYQRLNIVLSDGDCHLKQLSGIVQVKTQKGNIRLEQDAATIQAQSTYGTVTKNEIPMGKTQIHMESTSGNIRLQKIK